MSLFPRLDALIENAQWVSASSQMSLPRDTPGQHYVKVSALAAGFFELPDSEVFADSLETSTVVRVPSFVFLLDHPKHGKLLFDLGVKKHLKGYPPIMKQNLEAMKVECDRDAADILTEGGVSADTIKTIILRCGCCSSRSLLTPKSSPL